MTLAMVVKAYEKVRNAYDVAAILAMFADNAVVELTGERRLSNLQAIGALHAYHKGIQTQIHYHNLAVVGLTVVCQANEQNQWLATAGLGEIFYPSSIFTFTKKAKIKKLVATLSPEDVAAKAAVLAEFIPWLRANRPDEASTLLDHDGRFRYSERNGVLAVDLLTQWRAKREGQILS